MCAIFVIHTRVEKAYKFISLTLLPSHSFFSFTNQIVNCKNAVASQRNDDEWQANAECILFAVCDFIILAKYPGMQNTRSTMPSKCI